VTRTLLIAAVAALAILGPPTQPRSPAQLLPRNRSTPTPKLEPVAETRLLMEGLLKANVRGMEKNLAQPPADAETWTFVRGQALLVAETGNLLMIRPPKAGGQDAWMASAADLRDKGTAIARSAAARDIDRCRKGLSDLAATCNRCHQTFQVNVKVAPFQAGKAE
jgi:hypothetical protein